MPDHEKWRIFVIKELSDVNFDQSDVDGFTTHEINEIINFACTM